MVNKTLAEVCQSADKPMIVVFNKIDAYTHTPKDDDDLTERTRENIPLEELKQTWMNRLSPGNCVFVSAKAGTNIDELKDKIYTKAREIHAERFPYNDFLYQRYDQDMDTLS